MQWGCVIKEFRTIMLVCTFVQAIGEEMIGDKRKKEEKKNDDDEEEEEEKKIFFCEKVFKVLHKCTINISK